MKSFEDHVDSLIESLPLRVLKGDDAVVRERVRLLLLALARDQRHMCAEAVAGLNVGTHILDKAHQVVMNAPLP